MGVHYQMLSGYALGVMKSVGLSCLGAVLGAGLSMWERTCIFSLVEGDVVGWFEHTGGLVTYFSLHQFLLHSVQVWDISPAGGGLILFPDGNTQCGSILSSNDLVWMQIRFGVSFLQGSVCFHPGMCWSFLFFTVLFLILKLSVFLRVWASLPMA